MFHKLVLHYARWYLWEGTESLELYEWLILTWDEYIHLLHWGYIKIKQLFS